MTRWLKRQIEETKAEKARVEAEKVDVIKEKAARRDLLIEVADVVIELRIAAERLEGALQEVLEREDERNGTNGDGPVGSREPKP